MREARPSFPVLIQSGALRARIGELALEIGARYQDAPPVPVAVMEGARAFAGALTALLPGRPTFFEVRASSYGDGQESSGRVKLLGGDSLSVRGQRVLLIEDIVDTGRTVSRLLAYLTSQGAAEVAVATLLSKPSRRVVQVPLAHVGFEILDVFVIGFGMDVAGKYRDLDHIAVYDQALEMA